MFVQPFCSGKAISITYCEFVSVALGIQREMSMRHIVICGLSGCIIFLNIMLQRTRCSKNVIEHKMCFDFIYNFLSERFLIRRNERDAIKNVSWSA